MLRKKIGNRYIVARLFLLFMRMFCYIQALNLMSVCLYGFGFGAKLGSKKKVYYLD